MNTGRMSILSDSAVCPGGRRRGRKEFSSGLGSGRGSRGQTRRRTNGVDYDTHLVELFRTNVGAIGESKLFEHRRELLNRLVANQSNGPHRPFTHIDQTPPTLHFLPGVPRLTILISQDEIASDLGPTNLGRRSLCFFPRQPCSLFILEIDIQTGASECKQGAGADREGLRFRMAEERSESG